eukprot:1156485-Pelagomonas_calceolata.AAC.4
MEHSWQPCSALEHGKHGLVFEQGGIMRARQRTGSTLSSFWTFKDSRHVGAQVTNCCRCQGWRKLGSPGRHLML